MAQWSNTASESGILRKNKPKENHDDLLVFGYACKLFRDDDKALYIDQGKHLIPWMGDDNLKIDRYDCRGALSDIKLYESSREGYDTIRWLGLNESERKIEQLCDKERYYALEINEEEERMYKEEEEKRLKANQFQYSYDVPEKPSQPTEMGPTARDDSGGGGGEDDEVFVPPPNLDIPIDIEIPKTVKENARIEKTALFVHKQGLQMEILIKAKQSDNPQFGFLNQGHRLYKYYRHILSAIKNGLYQINTSATSKNDTKKEEDGDNPNDDHYLHPSLQSTTPTTATTSLNTATNDDVVDDDTSSIPTLPYKPSANCSYSQLVNRIQGSLNEQHNQQQFNDNMKLLPPIKSQEAYSQLTYEQQQYYQYYYMAQYYEYYKQLAQYQQNGGQQQQQQQQVQPPEIHLDPTIQNYIQQMAYMQYQQQQQQSNSVNPYAQIVNNLNNLTNCQQSETLSSSSIDQQQSFGVETRIVTKSSPKYDDEAEIKKPLLSLAQYGSDSDDDDGNDGGGGDGGDYKVPIGEIKIVIDKMASYVAKNGEQFEEIVRAKGDPRFEFLNNSHDYYQYYRKKIKESLSNNSNKNNKNNNERLEEKREIKMVAVPLQKPKEKKVIAPVSFSIKKPKDDGPKEIKSALPIEESDDEEDVDKYIETKNDSDNNNNNNNKDNDKIDNKLENNETDKKDEPILQINETIKNSNNSNNNNNNNNKDGIFDTDDPILEMIDLTDDIDDKQRDIKRAEDKIKDKLALAAREKLVLVNRDNRALQLERKRKAAAFLALKSAETLNVTINNNEECRLPDPTEMIVDDIIAKKRSDDDDNDDDDQEEDEPLEDKRRSKKKKSHKRKHSKSKYDSKSGRKKSKKKRRRSSSGSSTNSRSS